MKPDGSATALKELASFLGTNPHSLKPFRKAVEKIARKNKEEIFKTLVQLGKPRFAEEVRSLLRHRIVSAEHVLLNKFGHGHKTFALINAMNSSIYASKVGEVFVLKESKAKEMLRNDPPEEMMKILKYNDIDEMLAQEDIAELYCALRFVQSDKWMHDFFDKNYSKLKKDDFEQRKIRFILLDKRWLKYAGDFVKKKRHPTSHLKELGVVFALPTGIEKSGEFIKAYSVLIQFVYEVKFYTDLFKMYSGSRDFSSKFVSLLKGELPSRNLPGKVLVVQRYLYKDNPKDWRIHTPHVNPEALHWKRAEEFIINLDKGFSIWKDHYWVGAMLKSFRKNGVLVSFDFADNAVSVDFQRQLSYHYIEGLWYRIFEEHYGKEKLIKLMMKNMFRMYI